MLERLHYTFNTKSSLSQTICPMILIVQSMSICLKFEMCVWVGVV